MGLYEVLNKARIKCGYRVNTVCVNQVLRRFNTVKA